MQEVYIGQQGDIEVDPIVVKEQARHTVRQLVDAVVELCTNSDDSYRRQKAERGEILIIVNRLRGGRWSLLEVQDHAEGMSMKSLLEALRYGSKSSGFAGGLPVRGLWGRGMKETIIAFGEGVLETYCAGRLSRIKVWWDHDADRARWEIIADGPTSALNGTTVTVSPETGLGGKCPEFKHLYKQLCTHYALRSIVQNRTITLTVKSAGGRGRYAKASQNKRQLQFNPPIGELALDTHIKDTPFGPVRVRIWRSSEPLTFNRWDPCSIAGLLIKTQDVPLDNSLFGFEDEVGRYFFGEVDCPELADQIRKDASILTTTRTGIDWRQTKCRDFDLVVKRVLEPLVEKKRFELVSVSAPRIASAPKNRLLKMLNHLAQEELETSIDEGELGPGSSFDKVTQLSIKPAEGSAPPNVSRRYSVYLPKGIAGSSTIVEIDTLETCGEVRLDSHEAYLFPHPYVEGLLWGQFSLSGATLGDNTWIRCRIDGQEDLAYFEVKAAEARRKKRKKRLGSRGGGFFKDITPSSEPKPQQRVAYIGGVIIYFTEFPVVREYVTAHRFNTTEGKVLFAEMMSEAVCGALARKRITDGLVPGRPNEDSRATIGRYEAEVNRIRSRCLELVHRWSETYRVDTDQSDKR
jgi:hypothetical protein